MVTAPELADTYVPVPLRWRHVRPGDVIVGTDGTLWQVRQSVPVRELIHVEASSNTARQWTGTFDPDAAVNVLVPVAERDALTTARDVLAARVIERRAG